jgi:hypothetical protein
MTETVETDHTTYAFTLPGEDGAVNGPKTTRTEVTVTKSGEVWISLGGGPMQLGGPVVLTREQLLQLLAKVDQVAS